jgi:hypothetical protein
MLLIGLLALIIKIILYIYIIGFFVLLFTTYKSLSLEYKKDSKKARIYKNISQFLFILGFGIILLFVLLIHPNIFTFVIILPLFISGYYLWFGLIETFFFLYKGDNRVKISFIKTIKASLFFIISIGLINFASNNQRLNSKIKRRTYESCHDKEDWLLGGECVSRELKMRDIVGRWKMLPNRDIKDKKNYYFILKSNGKVEFHGYYVVSQKFGYDYIEHIDINSSWHYFPTGKGFIETSANPDNFHPYITIDIDKNSSMTFRFDAGEIKDELYLQNQYDDIDAPHYLTYKHEENLSYI